MVRPAGRATEPSASVTGLAGGRRRRSTRDARPARRRRRAPRRARRACRRRRSTSCSSTRSWSTPSPSARCRPGAPARRRRWSGTAAPSLCSLARTCAGVSVGCTDSISAAVPATSGAEKLVPSDACRSCRCRSRRAAPATGVVVPVLVVVRSGYRQALLGAVLTQLPPGALIAISGPRSEKPTLVPTWRRPATRDHAGAVGRAADRVARAVAGRRDDDARRRALICADRVDGSRCVQAPAPPRLRLMTRAGVRVGRHARHARGRPPSACRR